MASPRYLLGQGYATQTARLKVRLSADFRDWLSRRRLGIEDVEEEQVDAFLEKRKKTVYCAGATRGR